MSELLNFKNEIISLSSMSWSKSKEGQKVFFARAHRCTLYALAVC